MQHVKKGTTTLRTRTPELKQLLPSGICPFFPSLLTPSAAVSQHFPSTKLCRTFANKFPINCWAFWKTERTALLSALCKRSPGRGTTEQQVCFVLELVNLLPTGLQSQHTEQSCHLLWCSLCAQRSVQLSVSFSCAGGKYWNPLVLNASICLFKPSVLERSNV